MSSSLSHRALPSRKPLNVATLNDLVKQHNMAGLLVLEVDPGGNMISRLATDGVAHPKEALSLEHFRESLDDLLRGGLLHKCGHINNLAAARYFANRAKDDAIMTSEPGAEY